MTTTYYVMMCLMMLLTAYNFVMDGIKAPKSASRTWSMTLNAIGFTLCLISLIIALTGVV